MNDAKTTQAHRWKFLRLGGFDQVCLETGADIAALPDLDQKLWAALSCPTRGLEFDSRTLDLIDTGADGRIRVPEILGAVRWAASVLTSLDGLLSGQDEVPLQTIRQDTEEGSRTLSSAKQILANLGKPDVSSITLEDLADETRIFVETKLNGDGIVPPGAAPDEALKTVLQDIVRCCGGEKDRSGVPGVGQKMLEDFFTDAEKYSAWWKIGESDASNILPLGDDMTEAEVIFGVLKPKIDDYFTRCDLAALTENAAARLNPSDEQYDALSRMQLSDCSEEVAGLPLARIEAGKSLPLCTGINPAWGDLIEKLRARILPRLIGGRETLSASDWTQVRQRFGVYEAWRAAKEGAVVEPLGIGRVREILASNAKVQLLQLIEQDKALESQFQSIASVERLVRYHRDLFRLLNNFVSFHDFYSTGRKGMFQAGTLLLDGRSCELCVRVADPGKHATLASLAGTYLAYCDCTRANGSEKITIAAAFTDGDSDNLMVGRNGVFYDREGRDYDATIVKIVDHPIGVRQAVWAPYKRAARMIGQQIEKVAGAREKAVETGATASVAAIGSPQDPAKAPGAPPFDIAKFAGVFAAIGLAVGAIGTALASVLTGFLSLLWWQIPLALLGVMLMISGPSVVLAWLKLRERNLAPILDANGWAINTRARINIPFGTSLTSTARLPENAQRLLQDPFAEKKAPWRLYLLLAVLVGLAALAFRFGFITSALKWIFS